MSEKIIVKLRRDNISVSSCKEGVYLTFDAENARPIICKYSEVITIFTPNQIYDVEDIMLMLGPVLHCCANRSNAMLVAIAMIDSDSTAAPPTTRPYRISLKIFRLEEGVLL